MSWPGLAVVTLDEQGGGVAAVSRLIWQVFRDHWGDECRLTTLVENGTGPWSPDSTTPARLKFGAGLAMAQVLGHCRWVFYSHLALARVQTFVPQPFRRPYGIFLHGIEAWRPFTRAQRQAVEGAALVVANSAHTIRRVKEVHPWIGPIAECPLALPPARTRHDGTALVTPTDRVGPHAVLVVGRMVADERYKGHDQLLEAWPSVVARIADAQLVFVGAGDDAARLEAKAAALGVGACVRFTGFVAGSALAGLYERAAVFAMPSRNEGFGLVYLEAMAHGLPCVGSIHDAAAEIIQDGVTGFLVSQSDLAGLADRLVRLLADEAGRRAMGAAGARRLQEHFTYDSFRARLLPLLLASFGAQEREPLPVTPS